MRPMYDRAKARHQTIDFCERRASRNVILISGMYTIIVQFILGAVWWNSAR